ncbi:DUF2846 domain-containing protein [Oleiharenicola sp. Vm1]|uniref:DUF2846 domain-containing protein n=1 Tax=Oleiharenicola sp. Vm1 TaxID=3398393 RepID=UPI0039F4EEBD
MKYSKIVLIVVAAFAALLEVGCASVTRQATNVYPEPKPDKGLVYFYREKKFMGAAISYDITERPSNKVIGAIANGTYFFYDADPGSHTFVASTEADSSRTIQVEAGKTYYVECGVEMGVLAGRPALKIASDAEAKSVLPALQYATK